MKHKHSEVLHAFADGIECEYWCNYDKVWRTFVGLTIFEMGIKVRIKPEPQKEQEPQYLYFYRHIDTSKIMTSPTSLRETSEWTYLGKVRLEK
jgi:hypothetical protein